MLLPHLGKFAAENHQKVIENIFSHGNQFQFCCGICDAILLFFIWRVLIQRKLI
jgi:hypothetical protein